MKKIILFNNDYHVFVIEEELIQSQCKEVEYFFNVLYKKEAYEVFKINHNFDKIYVKIMDVWLSNRDRRYFAGRSGYYYNMPILTGVKNGIEGEISYDYLLNGQEKYSQWFEMNGDSQAERMNYAYSFLSGRTEKYQRFRSEMILEDQE